MTTSPSPLDGLTAVRFLKEKWESQKQRVSKIRGYAKQVCVHLSHIAEHSLKMVADPFLLHSPQTHFSPSSQPQYYSSVLLVYSHRRPLPRTSAHTPSLRHHPPLVPPPPPPSPPPQDATKQAQLAIEEALLSDVEETYFHLLECQSEDVHTLESRVTQRYQSLLAQAHQATLTAEADAAQAHRDLQAARTDAQKIVKAQITALDHQRVELTRVAAVAQEEVRTLTRTT